MGHSFGEINFAHYFAQKFVIFRFYWSSHPTNKASGVGTFVKKTHLPLNVDFTISQQQNKNSEQENKNANSVNVNKKRKFDDVTTSTTTTRIKNDGMEGLFVISNWSEKRFSTFFFKIRLTFARKTLSDSTKNVSAFVVFFVVEKSKSETKMMKVAKYSAEHNNLENEGRVLIFEHEKCFIVNTYVPMATWHSVGRERRIWDERILVGLKNLQVCILRQIFRKNHGSF